MTAAALAASPEFAYLARAWRDEYPCGPGFLTRDYLGPDAWMDRLIEEHFFCGSRSTSAPKMGPA